MTEQFIQQIKEYLTSLGFSYNSDNTYERNCQATTPGRIMIINGQQMQEPGQTINIKYIIEDLGDGYVSNVDDTDKKEMEFFNILTYTNDILSGEFNKSYYTTDIEEFKSDISRILQIQ